VEDKNAINSYICEHLHETFTINLHAGVTPFTISCPQCGYLAYSSMYKIKIDRNTWDSISHVWYKPTWFERLFLISLQERQHVKQGGLLLYKMPDKKK